MALASRTAARAPRGARPRYANVGAFLAAVAAEYESLPKQLRAIARYVETNRARMVVTRITDVAEACAVQPSAVCPLLTTSVAAASSSTGSCSSIPTLAPAASLASPSPPTRRAPPPSRRS